MATRERLAEQTRDYLEGRGWKYDVTERDTVTAFRFPMGIGGVLSPITEHVLVKDNHIMCIAVSPLKAKEENFANVVEYLTRANYGLNVGGFEFDYSDGEIRYRDCMTVYGEEATLADIMAAIFIPMNMMERYGDGLVKNIMGCGNPAEDIAFAESGAADA